MPEENDNEASEGDNNSFKNVLGKWSTRAAISDSEGNVAYVARLASMGKARSQTTTGNPQEDHMAPQGIPKSPMHVSPRASPRQFRKGQGGLMNRISRFEREQDSNGSSSQTSLVVDFPVGAVPLYTTKNNLGSSNGDLSKDESSSSVEQKEPQVDSAQSSIDDHSTSESSSSKKKEPIIVSPKYSKKKLMDSSDHSESSSERKFSTPNNGTKNKIKSYSEHSKGESLEGTDISPRLPPSPFGSRINSPKKSPKNNTPKKSPKRMSNGDKIISPNGQKVQQLHMLFGQPLTQAAAAASSSPGGKGSLPRDDRQYNSPCVTGSPVGMLHPETPKSWREKMGGGILSPPLTSSVPNTPTESSESEDYFQVSRSPSGFMKGRQRQGLGMLSPRLLQKKKPSYQTWKEKVAAALDDDDDDDLPSQDVDHRRRRNSALDEDESTPNDDDDDLGEMSLNDEIEPQGDGTIRSSLGVKGLAGRFNKKPKEEKPKDEVPKVYVRHTKELASKLEADRQVDNATSGEDGGTLLKDDSSPSRPTKVPSRLGSVNNLADRFHKKLAEMEKPMTESPRNRQGNVKDLVSKIKEEQEIEKQEEAEKRKEEKPADQPADKPDVRDSVGALAKKWEIKRVEDNPRSVGPAKSRRPQEQGLNKEVAREFIRQESARQLIEPVIEPVKETVKETDKGQKPIRRSMKKPSEDGECSGKKEEGEADPDNRRARLKATKSELHDLRRKLQATKSGIARKTEEVRAPLIATTGEFEPPVFVKEHFEEQLIRKALKRNFVFGDLDDDALATFIGAFEGIEVHKREKIMNQGDKGDYFYVIARGKVSFGINGVLVGTASEGTSFGELALLYTCPRAATVMASAEPTKLFRVDQKTFRHIMESKAKQMEELQLSLLRGVSFLKDLVESDLKRLSSVMFPRIFDTGEVITKKGDVGDAFYILYEGSVKVTDISIGNTSYEDVTLESGDHFGEMSLITSAVRAANVITLSKGTVFSIDRETFEKILGKFSRVILKAQDRQKLEGIKILRDARLEPTDFEHLISLLADTSSRKNKVVMKEGDETKAALYLVREGSVEISTEDGSRSEVVEAGGYFGDDQLLADAHGDADASSNIPAPYTVTASDKCFFGVLTLEDCRTVFDTKLLDDEVNQGPCPEIMKKRATVRDSVQTSVSLTDLKRHSMLGEGLFGQVWLVRADSMGLDPEGDSSGNFALKVQSKDSSTRADAAEAIKREMSVVQQLNHPFIVDLVHSYEDEDSVYMLMSVVTGGELWNVIHKEDDEGDWTSGIPEEQAKFYALIIADTLTYIHYQRVVYRDMKPENVLIDSEGYPIIVDFGFAKHCPDKTYTFCGTPNYLAPEIVMNRGHSYGADHWALGIVIYEMITGENPFHYDGMDQMSLFEAIVKEEMYPLPDATTEAAFEVIDGLLQKDSTQRLGMLAGGEKDILTHRWFEGINLTDMRAKKIKAPWIPPDPAPPEPDK